MEARATTDRWLYWTVAALSLLGLIVAGYLTYIKWFPAAPFCTGVGDCEAVNTSIYSEVAGIPVALLGALAYAAILIALLLEPRLPLAGEWGALFGFGVALAGVLYSAYLTYIEIAVIRKICPYCVTSAVVITLIWVLAGVRVYRKWLTES